MFLLILNIFIFYVLWEKYDLKVIEYFFSNFGKIRINMNDLCIFIGLISFFELFLIIMFVKVIFYVFWVELVFY